MVKRLLFTFLAVVAFSSVKAAEAQPCGGNIPRIGYLSTQSSTTESNSVFFREGLRELGYVEGKNIVIEYRYAEGDRTRLRKLAAELVRAKVDVIVATGNRATSAAKQTTKTIPIIIGGAGDLVGTGLVASLARPGGNVTGSTRMSSELAGKRIELLKEAISRLSSVAVILTTQQDQDELQEMRSAARHLGIKLLPVNVRGVDEFQSVFAAMAKDAADALMITHSGFTFGRRAVLAELAVKNHLATMCEQSAWSEAGCLMSYGPDLAHLYRRAAHYVDKVLKGAKPGDLPVERPTKFEFVINLKTAKQIGLTIPPNLLARADQVIR